MKNRLKKVVSFCLTCLMSTLLIIPAFALDNTSLSSLLSTQTFLTQDGKSLNDYSRSSYTTVDGMNITMFSDESDNIVAVITEDTKNLSISYSDGRMYTFTKNNIGTIDFKDVDITQSSFQYPLDEQSVFPETTVPNASNGEEFTSNFFPDDSYVYLDLINHWHLYYGGDHAFSGNSPSSTILNKCKDFKTNIIAMDEHLYDAAETITGYVPGVSVSLALAKLIQDANWKTATELVGQLVLLIPALGPVSTVLNTTTLFGHMLGALACNRSYKSDFDYVKANATS